VLARKSSVATARAARGPVVVAGVTITTPTRPVYPAVGFTKIDLARH
jgi:hypothetical protein